MVSEMELCCYQQFTFPRKRQTKKKKKTDRLCASVLLIIHAIRLSFYKSLSWLQSSISLIKSNWFRSSSTNWLQIPIELTMNLKIFRSDSQTCFCKWLWQCRWYAILFSSPYLKWNKICLYMQIYLYIYRYRKKSFVLMMGKQNLKSDKRKRNLYKNTLAEQSRAEQRTC